ncbi:MAG: VWA domain-containing protein [Pyrinomonadaceae bacterium]
MVQRTLLCLMVSLSILPRATAQQPEQRPPAEPSRPESTPPQNPPDVDSQDVVKITTNLVQIDVAVTKGGKQVTDLRPEDFEIFEDGKPQTITNFSYISNLPAAESPRPAAALKPKGAMALPVPPAKINLTDQRRIMALVVDDFGISFESMTQVRSQLRKFIDDLSPTDLVAIIRTGGDVGALQQFTNDKRVLQNALDRVRWNPCSRAGVHVFQAAGSIGGNTGLCSQYVMNSTLKSLNYIVKGMKLLPGRKSMILFSDYLPIQDQQPSAYEETTNSMRDSASDNTTGVDSQSPPSDPAIPDSGTNYAAQLLRIAELAIRSSVVIYSVDTRGLQYTGLTAADRLSGNSRQMQAQMGSIMASRSAQLLSGREGSDLIAKQTGGFLIRNSNDFGLKQIMNDQQGYYLIGFRPLEETFNRGFHHIKAKLKRAGLTVRTREGFYGFTDEEARPKELTAADEMNKAVISPFRARDISLRLTSFFLDDPSKGALIRSFLYLDPRDLSFSEVEGWHVAHLVIRSVVFGDNGKIMAQEDRTGTLRYRGSAYERAMREGIPYAFDVPVSIRGAFQFRLAVRDLNSSKIGSAGQFVEVPNLRNGRLALSGIVARAADDQPKGPQDDGLETGPVVRQFRQGSTVRFAYAIYNANAAGRLAQLTSQIRLIRDGKLVLTGKPKPINVTGQSDPQRLTDVTTLMLGTDLAPGDYVCQIVVVDSFEKDKPRVATQWIDFEVVK